MADTIRIREFEENDLGQVLDVLRASLGESALLRRTPELFSWKHIRNPFGRSIILLATSGDRIAGVRAFMRWELKTPDGETIRCVRAVDTATHPDFHRQGIFSRLTKEAVERAYNDDVDLIFNTPNPKSGAGYLKMGWSSVGDIGIMMRPTPRMVRRRPTAEPPDPAEFLASPRPFDATMPADRPAQGLRTPRTPEYYMWRFQQHPTARYFQVGHAGGTAVLRPNVRNGRRELVISELTGSSLRATASKVATASRADYLAGWWSNGPERSAARRAGLFAVPRAVALTLVARPLRDIPVTADQLSSWDLALSDLELL